MKFDLFWVQWYFWVLQHCGEIKKISICFCTGPDNFWPAPWQGDGRTFHTECLNCDDCGANVAGGAVFTRGDHILCGQCGGAEVSNKLILKITSRIVDNKCMYLLGSSEYLHNLLNHSKSGWDKSDANCVHFRSQQRIVEDVEKRSLGIVFSPGIPTIITTVWRLESLVQKNGRCCRKIFDKTQTFLPLVRCVWRGVKRNLFYVHGPTHLWEMLQVALPLQN